MAVDVSHPVDVGYRERSRSRQSTPAGTSPAEQNAAARHDDAGGAIADRPMSPDMASAYYGVPVADRAAAATLQRLEDDHSTPEVLQWVEEGMTTDVMGDQQAMQAFRQRQDNRPAEVPTTIERQNKLSVQRSAKAAADTSSAGRTDTPESVRDVITSPGQSLDTSIQRAMESSMGDSFSDVQIHTGPQAAQACEDINAKAFTVGNHVAFNSGEYDPESPEGQYTIAHELAHVRQQTQGRVSMLPQDGLQIDPDPQLEQEADETAKRVLSGEQLGIQRLSDTDFHVQRASKGNKPIGMLDDLSDPQKEGLKGFGKGLASEIPGVSALTTAYDEYESAKTQQRIEKTQQRIESSLQALSDAVSKLYDELGISPPESVNMADIGTETGGGSSTGDAQSRNG